MPSGQLPHVLDVVQRVTNVILQVMIPEGAEEGQQITATGRACMHLLCKRQDHNANFPPVRVCGMHMSQRLHDHVLVPKSPLIPPI
jgi:hypothetical protein